MFNLSQEKKAILLDEAFLTDINDVDGTVVQK